MRFNYTLDSPSPILKYSGNWTAARTGDPALSQYRNRTAMQTSTIQDQVSFSFNGTGVWVYGAKRSNHGRYSVILDTNPFEFNGNTPVGQDEFQVPLFSSGISGNLSSGPHEITLTNDGPNGTYLDIDFIIWEGELPDDSKSKSFGNNGTRFEFLPDNSRWGSGPDPHSYDGTLYWTEFSSGAFRFNFTGQSVALYAYLDADHGNFSCSIDGVSRGFYSGYYYKRLFQQLMCFGDNLDDGDHVLSVTNHPLSTDIGWFSVDYVEVWGTDLDGPTSSNEPTNHPTPSVRSSTHTGIIGGVIGGVVLLAVLVGLANLFVRRKVKRARRGSRPVEHRDTFEIDGHLDILSDHGDHGDHSHVIPYDPYRESMSTVAGQSTYVTEVLGSSYGGTSFNLSGGNRSSGSFSPNDSQSQSGSGRHRAYSNTSKYLAPLREQDAGPLLPFNDSGDGALSGPSLPPLYSSIVSTQPWKAALRDEKPVIRHVAGLPAEEHS